MRSTSHRFSRSPLSRSAGETGASMADALAALLILALALSIAITPISLAARRVQALADGRLEILGARRQALE